MEVYLYYVYLYRRFEIKNTLGISLLVCGFLNYAKYLK